MSSENTVGADLIDRKRFWAVIPMHDQAANPADVQGIFHELSVIACCFSLDIFAN